ncbi:DNA-formamidopyrimidine glycosylase [Candidatus Daviesbacteria bacterium RIFCSPHIGHO2_02_FULL_39_12]|uniref:DNA-formamidopyrimidine glycosylase n=2 Tax=Candidatus Daviesiibacteriota TaxID=1752718 RepID=A0A1F5JBU2_9BACT|nr:MAG: DNA-formamidopyrimidine glycosylase [Candidatus Daviesbacteria bacterium RIFCSPHIGHO2_02_FULL_39_12]OGE71363.1 MAG: DNA-formamidopyrimidine glycosylase [Candidatus Daviesbacteria bacterium RIFCSPLOWO2_02_FULL_38_15]
MPELPEIETIKIELQKKIIGSKLTKIQILSPKSLQNEKGQPFDYAQGLQGRKVLNIWRRAKILGIDLSSSLRDHEVAKQSSTDNNEIARNDKKVTLLFHLKMSGQLVWKGKRGKGKEESFIGGHPTEDMLGKMPNIHTRVIFSFADGSHLYFNDLRRFGWVKVVRSEKCKVQSEEVLGKLGPEPLEKGFIWQILKTNLLKHKTQVVKVALMDQTVVAGIGNIYASEALFNAKIDPRTKVSQLTDRQIQSLHQGVLRALRDGIKYGGSTRAHFVDAQGHKGYFLDYAYVYGRSGHKCKICGAQIKKIQQAGRGTYLCPSCQR